MQKKENKSDLAFLYLLSTQFQALFLKKLQLP